jgi:oligoribonuclease
MSNEPTHILFYDLETTGTDEKLDGILEIGCVLYNLAFDRTSERWWAVTPTESEQLRLATNDYVREMHLKSGLLTESRISAPAGQVDTAVCQWLRTTTGSTRHVISAGSGVAHFDRRFLKEKMPHLDRSLTYWSLDVGVMRRLCEYSGRSDLNLDQETKTHRALDDARFHYQEWRHYRSILAGAMPPVPEGALQ